MTWDLALEGVAVVGALPLVFGVAISLLWLTVLVAGTALVVHFGRHRLFAGGPT